VLVYCIRVDYNRYADYLNTIDKAFFDEEYKHVDEHWDVRVDRLQGERVERIRAAQELQDLEDKKLLRLLHNAVWVDSGSTVKVTKYGKLSTYWVMCIAGDENGTVGFGIGKASEVGEAQEKAVLDIKNNLLFVPLIESRTILHATEGRFGVTKCIIRPLPRHHGMTAGFVPRVIFDAVGIEDVNAKIYGRALPKNQVMAVFDALRQQNSIRELAIGRGVNAHKMFERGTVQYRHPSRQQMQEKFNELQGRLAEMRKTLPSYSETVERPETIDENMPASWVPALPTPYPSIPTPKPPSTHFKNWSKNASRINRQDKALQTRDRL
jgi:small subunit ribosomal protein S5